MANAAVPSRCMMPEVNCPLQKSILAAWSKKLAGKAREKLKPDAYLAYVRV
jgi:hypothetical protein